MPSDSPRVPQRAALFAGILGIVLAGSVGSTISCNAGPAEDTEPHHMLESHGMKIIIRLKERTLNATLNDSAAARDFAALLPLTLTLTDYVATEKVSNLPRALVHNGAPDGLDPSVGDITYYAPWGNLAIFHRDFGYAAGLVALGRIEDGVDVLARPGPICAIFERVTP